MRTHPAARSPALTPIIVMVLTPALFSTNIIFGRFMSAETTPFLLAFVRWLSVGLILAATTRAHWPAMARFVRRNAMRLFILGLLGMGICGGGVYLGLQHTTATNATLIYTTSPVLIVLLERFLRARPTHAREIAGTVIAFVGVAIIVARGEVQRLTGLQFNIGDMLIAAAALSWSVYSILYRETDPEGLPPRAMFALLALFGALANLPLAVIEVSTGGSLPLTGDGLLAIVGIVFVSSLAAFTGYQYGLRTLGPSLTGMFMYLMSPAGVLMAVLFLGETLRGFHLAGIAAVLGGVVLATWPKRAKT